MINSRTLWSTLALAAVCVCICVRRGRADITTGLIAHWTFDEGMGTTIGDSAGNFGGVYMSGLDQDPGPDWIQGKVGPGAMNFDGGNPPNDGPGSEGQWITVPDSAPDTAVQLRATSYTVAFWLHWTAPIPNVSTHRIVHADPGNEFSLWGFNIDPAGKMIWSHHSEFTAGQQDCCEGHNTGTGLTVPSNNGIGEWSHWAFVYNQFSGIRNVYLNGTQTKLGSVLPVAGNNDDGLALAGLNLFGDVNNPQPFQYFPGALDDVRIYNRTLSIFDIQELRRICDFNNDSLCDVRDINLMYDQGNLVGVVGINSLGPGHQFDLANDRDIDNDDINRWLLSAARHNGYTSAFLRGDTAGLGAISPAVRSVDITDFNALSSNFDPNGTIRSGNTWDKGNFDGDGDIDISDFNFLASNFAPFGYEATTSSVPEPSAILLLSLAVIGFGCGVRRSRFCK